MTQMKTPPPLPPPSHPPPKLHLDNLRALKILGKGATGTVFLVHDVLADPSARSPFALKVVQKSKHDDDRRARWEIRVLTRLSDPPHPFLPRLLGCLETPDLIAWAVPYCPGSDLNVLRHRQNDGVFAAAIVRFYLAEILCAVEHLHSIGLVYRDLKPENILIQNSGHVTLTDFDLSRRLKKKQCSEEDDKDEAKTNQNAPFHEMKKHRRRNWTRLVQSLPVNTKTLVKKPNSARVSPVSRRKLSFDGGERSHSFVGTEEYVAPEVVRGDGHEFAVDWWALGVLTYEMMYGTSPFRGKNRKETFRNVLTKQPELRGPRTELTDLIRQLLEKDPKKRLGFWRGAAEIKEHAFFKGVRWELLTEVLRPPFIPAREEVELEKATAGSMNNIRGYFEGLKVPPRLSLPPSPLPSPSSDHRRNVSFAEY